MEEEKGCEINSYMDVSAHPCLTLPPNARQGEDSQGGRENGHLSHTMKTVSFIYSSLLLLLRSN